MILIRRAALLVIVLVSGLSAGSAQELVTLTTPITTANATNVRLERLVVDLPAHSLYVQWLIRDAGGVTRQAGSAVYPTPAVLNNCGSPSLRPTGTTLITTINTANFSVNSLTKRLFQQLIADCDLPVGTISGVPE